MLAPSIKIVREIPNSFSTKPTYTVAVDQVSEAEWGVCLSSFDDANLYQTWAYGSVAWKKSKLSHLILKRNNIVVGLAQVRIIQPPLLPIGIAYLRWGPIWRRRGQSAEIDDFREILSALCEEYVRRRGLSLRIIPNAFEGEPRSDLVQEELRSRGLLASGDESPYRTILVDLTAPTDLLRKQLAQKWRNQLNAAERNALVVSEGTHAELFVRFLALYDEMMERKQFETHVDPKSFLEMQQRLPQDQKMLIMLAEKDGQLMSGLIATALGDTGIYLHGATSNAGMKFKGSYLLQWLMMQRLRERGCSNYDLGGINPERNPGVYHFKQGFGGREAIQLARSEVHSSKLSALCVRFAENALKKSKNLDRPIIR
jgi:hypothetical protein